jgi:NAD kinase
VIRSRSLPRVVLVTRKTPLQILQARHGTLAQAEFYLRSRGEDVGEVREMHERLSAGLDEVIACLPADQRRTLVDRDQIDRFLFAPDDLVVVVGQDGLVPNVAKYLSGQLTIGVNPDPSRYDGVLCQHPPRLLPALLDWVHRPTGHGFRVQQRTMLAAEREDGQRLLALNELFVGHRTHQSARYRLRVAGSEERQSSSGIICATGTGCTGWALSIARQRRIEKELPEPEEGRGVWLVREPFPSVHTRVSLDFGPIAREAGIEIASEMAEDGVVFADGIEADRIEFADGHTLRIGLAEQRLALVVRLEQPAAPATVRRRRKTRASRPGARSRVADEVPPPPGADSRARRRARGARVSALPARARAWHHRPGVHFTHE